MKYRGLNNGKKRKISSFLDNHYGLLIWVLKINLGISDFY